MEEWRHIKGYEGIYQVSNEGRVRSVSRYVKGKSNSMRLLKGHILKQIEHGDYIHVFLYVDKIGKWFEVHQLVAKAFIPNPNGYDVVHHKNHNSLDNRVENLEWMLKNKHAEMHSKSRIKKTVYQYTIDGKLVKIWASCGEAAKVLNYNESAISTCCRGRRFEKRTNKWVNSFTYKGYKWSYKKYV